MIMVWNWSDIWHFLVFQATPYAIISILIVASILRWVLAPYSWKTQSSQILGSGGSLFVGANLFHFGVVLLFCGHFFGLFTPKEWLDAIGLTPPIHQMTEVIMGGFAATLSIIGILILACRRWFNSRVRRSSRMSDHLVLIVLIFTLIFGLTSLLDGFFDDPSGVELVTFGNWAKALVTFQPDAWKNMVAAPIWQKIHISLGLLVFLLVPFTRLVHIWSGFFSPTYLIRPHQIMRTSEKTYR